MKKNWMAELVSHYEDMTRRYPQDKLMILFDIDGTILDMRHMILFVLKSFDKEHNTRFFRNLKIADLTIHENQVDHLLARMQIPKEEQKVILDWYDKNRWSQDYILHAHRPFSGVLEVIRWFDLQPNTFVALNTGRPETIRSDTLRSLNELGLEYRVQFSEEFLYMNTKGWDEGVENAKAAGVRHYQEEGYRIFAMVDNEPQNLKAISKIDPDDEILLLHADTIFESKRDELPSDAVKGKEYDLTELIFEKALPQHIQLVWHGINDEANLRQFMGSDIHWGECDARLGPLGNELIVRHDSFKNNPLDMDEEWLSFDQLLSRLKKGGKCIKIDVKAGGFLVEEVLKIVDAQGFDDSELWFNGNVERLQEGGFRQLYAAHPDAILQCPVDFLAPLIRSAPQKAKEILDMFASWGISRYSISWMTEDMRPFFDQMDKWGLEVNIYNVTDLTTFLQAVLLMPRSITSDFNFPKWHYYGRGSGKDDVYYEYSMHETPSKN